MDVKTLMTAEALILAGLLAWAQLWVHTYRIYRDDKTNKKPAWHVHIALAAIYTAVLGCLSSIALAAYVLLGQGTSRHFDLAVELAGFSTSIAFILVLQAAAASWYKALIGKQEMEPLPIGTGHYSWLWTLAATAAGIALLVGWLLRFGWLEIPPPS